MRFIGKGSTNTTDLITGLTPYPRLIHGTHQMSSMCEPEDMIAESQDIDDVISSAEDNTNKFCCFSNQTQFDDEKFLADINTNLLGTNYTFRGQFSYKEFSESLYLSEYSTQAITEKKMDRIIGRNNISHCLVNRNV